MGEVTLKVPAEYLEAFRAPNPEPSEAEILSEGLVWLRRLSHCSTLPEASRAAARLLARTVERRQSRPELRAVAARRPAGHLSPAVASKEEVA